MTIDPIQPRTHPYAGEFGAILSDWTSIHPVKLDRLHTLF